MDKDFHYDCIIVGGGLAGLSLSILLAKQKKHVLLIEKKSYPYHKVCGEYISNESWDFLERLGIPLSNMNLPKISKLNLTSIQNQCIEEDLFSGGFGISRYLLDKLLSDRAKFVGVNVMEQTLCTNYKHHDNEFIVQTKAGDFKTKILCASFGRHSFGDFYKPKKSKENWVGVKYHIKYNFPDDTIALNTFKNGYCGISKIEDNMYCLCYLVKASLLNLYKNNIEELEKSELSKNPFLKDIFNSAVFLNQRPYTISNIIFESKQPIYNHVFYLGDSAGSIAPLTGNGMSNALRSAWILSTELELFFNNKQTMHQLERNYRIQWNREFKSRIYKGRIIQYFFCLPYLTRVFIFLLKQIRWIRKIIIKQTHGKPF